MTALPDHRAGGIRGLAARLGGIAPAAGASIVRSRLFIKYVALFVAVVSLALVANGVFDVYFTYQEQKASLVRIQREQAEAAAGKIGQFIGEIESQVGWTTQLPWSAGTLEQRRFDALRLLRQVPAITELAEIDSSGHEQLKVSRLAMEVVGSGTDVSKEPSFAEAVAHKVYYGPVKKVSFIVDADIRSFFDTISQRWLIRFLEHRIGDRRIIRLIQKWLKAGILEDGVVAVSDRGTGQGSVISPLLSNIYLHYALDLWAARWRRRTAAGDMIIVRYADDFIVGFQHESDAQRFLNEMRERLREFALSLHPEKTRLIEFGRFAAERRKRHGLGKPETFNFLGFTFICSKTRAGRFQIQRKTRADRMRAKLQEIKQEMRRRMHQPILEQGRWLERVVRGYFNYHAVPTNGQALEVFRHHVTDLWRRTLLRRSQKDRVTWARMTQLVDDWLPKPTTLHPWPSDRFAVTHPRWEPYAGKPHVRFCAGGAS